MAKMLNGLDVDELTAEVDQMKRDPAKCRMVRTLTAEWVGGTRARVYARDKQLFIGGEEDFGAMSVTLASLLACEVDLIATHATLQGIELEKLVVEGHGEFNAGRYMGVVRKPRPGYKQIEYTIRVSAKNASPEQLRKLAMLCETESPVGDTIAQSVPTQLKVVVD